MVLNLFTLVVVMAASAYSAPFGAQDACADAQRSSLKLSHLAKAASAEARSRSPDLADFSSTIAYIEAKDKCDPLNLKETPMQCVGKILSILRDYSHTVQKISAFQGCKDPAGKVSHALKKLHRDVSKCMHQLGGSNESSDSNIHEEDTLVIKDWKEPYMCRHTLDRLFSFSVLTARVFAYNTDSSDQSCV